MGNKRNKGNFISNEQINNNAQNNFSVENNALFYGFFNALFNNIKKTYLGSDVINNIDDISQHFEWCYNETVRIFENENRFFKNHGPLYDYLYYFFLNSYYKKPNEASIKSIYVFFEGLFNSDQIKTKNEMETYNFLYKLFELSLKK